MIGGMWKQQLARNLCWRPSANGICMVKIQAVSIGTITYGKTKLNSTFLLVDLPSTTTFLSLHVL